MTEPATPAVETEDDRVTIKLFVSLISINEDSDGGDPTWEQTHGKPAPGWLRFLVNPLRTIAQIREH